MENRSAAIRRQVIIIIIIIIIIISLLSSRVSIAIIRLCDSVILSVCPHDKTKTAVTKITKRATEIVHQSICAHSHPILSSFKCSLKTHFYTYGKNDTIERIRDFSWYWVILVVFFTNLLTSKSVGTCTPSPHPSITPPTCLGYRHTHWLITRVTMSPQLRWRRSN